MYYYCKLAADGEPTRVEAPDGASAAEIYAEICTLWDGVTPHKVYINDKPGFFRIEQLGGYCEFSAYHEYE